MPWESESRARLLSPSLCPAIKCLFKTITCRQIKAGKDAKFRRPASRVLQQGSREAGKQREKGAVRARLALMAQHLA